jgi:hypothetical protein
VRSYQIGVLQPKNLHGDLEAAPSKPLFRVGTKTGNIELLGAPRRIAVKSSLEFVLEIADHDLFNASADGAMLALEVGFVGKEISKQGAEILVDVAGPVQTACLLLASFGINGTSIEPTEHLPPGGTTSRVSRSGVVALTV